MHDSNLTAAQMRYLLAIYQLSKKGDIRSSDVADHLAVSRPSAHRMIEHLLKRNLILKEKYSLIRLTESSRKAAEHYQNGFLHISRFLHEYLSLSQETAEDGALSIMSGLDDDGLKEICGRIRENL